MDDGFEKFPEAGGERDWSEMRQCERFGWLGPVQPLQSAHRAPVTHLAWHIQPG